MPEHLEKYTGAMEASMYEQFEHCIVIAVSLQEQWQQVGRRNSDLQNVGICMGGGCYYLYIL